MPKHARHLRPGHGGHPPRGAGHVWIVSAELDESRDQFADRLIELGQALKAGPLVLNGTSVDVPGDVTTIVRYERPPHGGLSLMIRADWSDDAGLAISAASQTLSIGTAER